MPLTQAQTKQVHNWINQRAPNLTCPVCQATNWQIGELVAASVLDGRGNDKIGSQIAPMVQIICGHCAHVQQFAAIPIFDRTTTTGVKNRSVRQAG
jgi:hypothetical protein